MKKVISIVLSCALVISLAVGCGKNETKKHISEVKITLPKSTGSQVIVEGEAVLATQTYLLARAYLEKLETVNVDSFNAKEYSELVKKTVEAIRISEVFNNLLEKHASELAKIEENKTSSQKKLQYKVISSSKNNSKKSPFANVLHAKEEKTPAIKYAEELTKTFDNAKNGQKLKAVAEKYGTDIKKAKVMLEQAQSILEGDAYEKQADFENKCYQVAVETKAAASTIGFGVGCAAVMASGGIAAASFIEKGGLVVNGINAIIDMGTAVTIHSTHGEGNEYTAAWERTGEMVAPISAVFAIGGGIQNIKDLRDPDKALKAVDNAAQAFITGLGFARDYVQDGTVLGVSSKIIDGYREIMVRSADISNSNDVKEVIEETGCNKEVLVDNKNATSKKQSQDEVLKTQMDAYIKAMGEFVDPSNPINFDEIFEKINEEFIKELKNEEGREAKAEESDETKTEDSDKTKAEEEKESKTSEVEKEESSKKTETQKILSINDVVGTYHFQGEGGVWTQNITVVDATHLKLTDDEGASIVGRYDENAGVVSYSEGNEEYTASAKVTFTKVNGGIKADMTLSMNGETKSATAMKE